MKYGHRKFPLAKRHHALTAAVSMAILLAACSTGNKDPATAQARDVAIDTVGPVLKTRHDGESDGLLGGFA